MYEFKIYLIKSVFAYSGASQLHYHSNNLEHQRKAAPRGLT